MKSLPKTIETSKDLIEIMTQPSVETERIVSAVTEPMIILGVGGKMGPTLAEKIIRAGGKVIGVDIFPDERIQKYLDQIGVQTIKCDLFDDQQVVNLPRSKHVFLMVGTKFGATGNEPFTWAMNAYLPAKLMERFSDAQVVYVSSGNVYKFSSVKSKGAKETDELDPIGEYAMSRLGAERIVTYISNRNSTPTCIVRLFYATELRYGIIHDLATKIRDGVPIELSMGYFNQIWQGDACDYLIRCLELCSVPATIINLTGPEVLSVRKVAEQLGQCMGIAPKFVGVESDTALLGDASELLNRFGMPLISADQIVDWVAHWVMHGGESLGKPTKFEKRNGKF
ncbi:MAG: NAD(P)-dependent oxidoreductase [candidate division KSB1 bacterium]|nr:NAD(P)-dependent oxidoreductase [candidate division KSB1 bacterium]MDZ7358755.1 NAD(P)-dependent oxidoreductase [candidate division KSB1 bacterium]MDZ7402258.1 NAD(P)-dependent oxidoreductase [candidate division KSB1 bacterium]